MEERKSSFSAQYAHVWISGAPGLAFGHVTIPDLGTVEELITELFYNNIIADAWHQKKEGTNGITKSYVDEHKIVTSDGEHKLFFVTSESRIDELLAVCEQVLKTKAFDVVMMSPKTGNKEYLEWARTQTVTVGSAPNPPEKEFVPPPEGDPLVPRPETLTVPDRPYVRHD